MTESTQASLQQPELHFLFQPFTSIQNQIPQQLTAQRALAGLKRGPRQPCEGPACCLTSSLAVVTPSPRWPLGPKGESPGPLTLELFLLSVLWNCHLLMFVECTYNIFDSVNPGLAVYMSSTAVPTRGFLSCPSCSLSPPHPPKTRPPHPDGAL